MSTIAVITTIDDIGKAREIARALVERGLVACAQISTIESVYAWQGAVQNETEYRVLLKTTEARYGAVEAAIRELHTYDLPAIFAFPVAHAYAPFADWVAASVATPAT